MATVPAALVTMLVLLAAGVFPALALAGLRVVALVLAPLAGAVVAALAATCFVAWGWTFFGWFVLMAVAGVAVVTGVWARWPERRPWTATERPYSGLPRWSRLVWLLGVAGIVAACVWSLRALGTPTVGFDARAVWLMRAGWFLEPHRQLLIDFKSVDIPLVQTPYPPLVSAVPAVAQRITGNTSMRLGVVVIALLNTCALVAATLAVLDAGRTVAARLSTAFGGPEQRTGTGPHAPSAPMRAVALAPVVVAAVAAVLLVLIAFGINEPFMTNGYADPIWSLAAVGSLAYGLQLPVIRANQGVAAVLVLVAGLSKNEGLATASALIVLIALRTLASQPGEEPRRRWWRPVLVAVVELAAIGSWPALMHYIHARGVTSTHSPFRDWWGRARATYDWMTPYLHILVLAVPLAIIGGLVLGRVRRTGGLGNDWWGWAGMTSGLAAIAAAFITGSVGIVPWLESTVHRVTEFPALAAWWIVAVWAVVASAAPAAVMADDRRADAPSEAGEEPEPDHDRVVSSVGAPVS